jgi:hypothetical protein
MAVGGILLVLTVDTRNANTLVIRMRRKVEYILHFPY